MIKIESLNETYIRVLIDDLGIEMEIQEYFTFFVPGYKYTPKFRSGQWDGKIRLFNLRNKCIYKGLLEEIIKYCKNHNYEFTVAPSLNNRQPILIDQIKEFVEILNLHGKGNKLDIREYQYDAIHRMLTNKRQVILSPTASGKSLLIYSYMRWMIETGKTIMIVVPTTLLVEQLLGDFKDYSSANGWDVGYNVSTLYSGKERIFNKPVLISTWQTLASMMKNDPDKLKELTERINVGVWDEFHTQKATVSASVIEKFSNTAYRIGCTGTLDDTKVNTLVLTGLIGPVYKVITTKQLMDNNQVVKLDINCIILNYPDTIKKAFKGMDYKVIPRFVRD